MSIAHALLFKIIVKTKLTGHCACAAIQNHRKTKPHKAKEFKIFLLFMTLTFNILYYVFEIIDRFDIQTRLVTRK